VGKDFDIAKSRELQVGLQWDVGKRSNERETLKV